VSVHLGITDGMTVVSGILSAREKCDRGCGASFAWAITVKGKRQPIDPEPRPDGNLALARDSEGVLHSYLLGPGDVPKGDRYVTHFATCPQASRFRK
jgi:hypothetical protein